MLSSRRMNSEWAAGAGGSAAVSEAALTAFFYGKAFAEVVNERLGEAMLDGLAELQKLSAEQEKEMQRFQLDPQAAFQGLTANMNTAISEQQRQLATFDVEAFQVSP